MAKSRSQLFRDLNVKPTNIQWAWCAKNPSSKRAVFTLWEDLELPNKTWLIHEKNESYRKRGYFDQEKVVRLALSENYEILGLVCVAKDPNADKRTIQKIKEDLLYNLQFIDQGDQIFVKVIGKSSLLELIRKDRLEATLNGLQDLNDVTFGSDNPDRALNKGFIIQRDNRVREAVLKRANGKCEYCGSPSFKTSRGENYLEAHHIISLAQKGKDRMSNVIALCPSHHREAHFGKTAEKLEEKFLKILKAIEK